MTLPFVILVIVFVFFAVAVDGSLSCHLIAFQILIIGSDLIDDGTIRQNLDDSVCGGLYDLMVTGGKEKYSREFNETVVESGDGLHIQMVGRLLRTGRGLSSRRLRRRRAYVPGNHGHK